MERKVLSTTTSVKFDKKRPLKDSAGNLEAKRPKLSDQTSSTSQPDKRVTLEDEENLKPAANIHKDNRIHMGKAELVPMQNGNEKEQVLMLFNSTRTTQQSTDPRPCCDQDVDLRYGVSNKHCANECRIPAGEKYMENVGGVVNCIKCYNKKFPRTAARKKNLRSWREEINLNKENEKTYTCTVCGIEFHQCCSLDIWVAPFICPNCPKPEERRMRVTLDDYPRNDFEKSMEEAINGFYQVSLREQNETLDSKFSVVTYRNKTSTETKNLVPAKYCKAFIGEYGKKIEYYQRTILLFQRLGGVDVLVYVMYAQEYPDIRGKKWLVVDYMDSVAYVKPRRMSGHVFGELIISYFSYMSTFGYENVHLFADPPVQNDDYVFHIHPSFQVYKGVDSLIRYYLSVFAKGKRDRVISRIQKFKETNFSKKYESPTDIIPFDGGLWSRCMLEIELGLKEDKIPRKDYNSFFEYYMKAKFEFNAENNFFLELSPRRQKLVDLGELKTHKIFGDREEFLERCTNQNWELSSLRRAKYASVGIISWIFEEPEE